MTVLRIRLLLAVVLVACSCAVATALLLRAGRVLNTSVSAAPAAPNDARLNGAYRFDQSGWVYVHLEGDPDTVGFQHGSLLAPEIEDAFQSVKLHATHETKRDWEFFRQAGRKMLWPHIDPEYQTELQGIADGLKSKGVAMDLDDVVAMNAFEEMPDYYVPWLNAREKLANAPHINSPLNCSAFVAAGSWTKDHQIVMAHNNWTNYMNGERWRIIFDIVPAHGFRIFMDGFPGVIASDDDFGVNSEGLMVTETTISQFNGWDPDGKPEFVRARKAMQYAGSIDDYVKIMLDGNNGGYANDWLLGDRKTGEIARFELGLKHYRVWRSKDGYYVGSNFASDPQVLVADTSFDTKNRESSPNARHIRWEELMASSKGQLDVPLAQRLISDHYDSFEKKDHPDARTLCGHGDAAVNGIKDWDWQAYYPGGAVQGKAMDSNMARNMTFVARMGHPCGADFHAKDFLAQHPEFSWQAPLLRDMIAGPWTQFRSGERAPN
jgi:hypothetical protein